MDENNLNKDNLDVEEKQNNIVVKNLKDKTHLSNKKLFLKKYFSFSGRMNRKEFIISSLYLLVLTVLSYFFLTAIVFGIFGREKVTSLILSGLLLVLTFTALYANVSLSARRFLDLGIDSRWLFLVFGFNFFLNPRLYETEIAKYMIAGVGLFYSIFLLYLFCFKKGTIGANKYGADPLASEKKKALSKFEKKVLLSFLAIDGTIFLFLNL